LEDGEERQQSDVQVAVHEIVAVGAGVDADAGVGPLRLPSCLVDLRYRWEILERVGDEGSRKGPTPAPTSTPFANYRI
jgi:hypothetical protein